MFCLVYLLCKTYLLDFTYFYFFIFIYSLLFYILLLHFLRFFVDTASTYIYFFSCYLFSSLIPSIVLSVKLILHVIVLLQSSINIICCFYYYYCCHYCCCFESNFNYKSLISTMLSGIVSSLNLFISFFIIVGFIYF